MPLPRRALRTAVALAGGLLVLARVPDTRAAPEPGASVPPSKAASTATIRRLLAERVEAAGDGVGLVVAVVRPNGRRIVSYGHLGRPLGGDTAFEIGSVGKVLTGLLLADMVRRGEVALDAPAARYLPAGVQLPERDGHAITLLDLATHTSGLPFMPDDRPLAAYEGAETTARLYGFLARREPAAGGGAWDYSNLGYWLLGEALTARAGLAFEPLLRQRVLAPLHLTSTAVTATPALRARLARGHDAGLRPTPALSLPPVYAVMPAAGTGMVSTADDLARLVAAVLDAGRRRSPLAQAIALQLGTRRPLRPGVEQALGWVVEGAGDDALITHDGGTFGYASSVAVDLQRQVGVVVLANQVGDVGDLARHLLRPSRPLAKPAPPEKHTEIALDPAELDAYAGQYEATGEGIFLLAREGGALTIEPPAGWGLPKYRLHPESRLDFFVTELPLRVTFQVDGDGRIRGILVYPPRGQKAVPASRIGPSQRPLGTPR